MLTKQKRKLQQKRISLSLLSVACPVKMLLSQTHNNKININVNQSCTFESYHFEITVQSTSVLRAENQRLSLCILRLATETVRGDLKNRKPKRAINNAFTVIQTDKHSTPWHNRKKKIAYMKEG